MRKQFTPTLPKPVLLCFALFALSPGARAQHPPAVTVPRDDDQYSKLVRKLEAGETTINYREFRESFLESEQFKAIGNEKPDLETLRKTLHELMETSKYADIVGAAKKMLSLDYTDMEAHKILHQTYKKLGDVSNQKRSTTTSNLAC
jgi:two-component SAPR family response regulator